MSGTADFGILCVLLGNAGSAIGTADAGAQGLHAQESMPCMNPTRTTSSLWIISASIAARRDLSSSTEGANASDFAFGVSFASISTAASPTSVSDRRAEAEASRASGREPSVKIK